MVDGVSLNLILESLGEVEGLGVVCHECGSKFNFSLDLSRLECSNKRCKSNCIPKIYEYLLYQVDCKLDKIFIGLTVEELYEVIEDMYVYLGIKSIDELLKVSVNDIKVLQESSDEVYKVGLNIVAYLESVKEENIEDYLKARGVKVNPEISLKGISTKEFKRQWKNEEYRLSFIKEYEKIGQYRLYRLVREIDEAI